jgi:DNA-binding transcriptional LysR family regulator
LVSERSEVLAARLRDLQLDVGIIREEALETALKSAPFATFSYALYVPRLLAGPTRSLPRWLPHVPMIGPPEGWTRKQVNAAAAAAGVELRIELEGASATLAVRALRDGNYAAILPEIAGTELADTDVIVLRPAFLRALERRLVIAWHPRQADTRPVILQAVAAIKELRLEPRLAKAAR